MMRKIYILDFDGTLGDSRGLILRTMMDTFDALGIDPVSYTHLTLPTNSLV